MVVGAKVCELTDGFLWFVCGNFDVSPKTSITHSYFTSRPQSTPKGDDHPGVPGQVRASLRISGRHHVEQLHGGHHPVPLWGGGQQPRRGHRGVR